jgi:uncharacterized protein YbaP (TraB family)
MYRRLIVIFFLVTLPNFVCIAQSTIIWSITNPTINDTSFIVGTFHQMGNSFIDSIPEIKKTLLESEIAIFESIDTSEKVISFLNSRVDDYTYQKTLSKSDLVFLQSYSSDWTVPIGKLHPIELLIKLQQEYIKNNCGTVKSLDTWSHFDKYLIHIASTNNINIVGLENDSTQTIDIDQIGNKYNWQMAKKDIHTWILNIKKHRNKSIICHQANEYMSFSFNYQFSTDCQDSSLIMRNKKWLPIIIENIKDKKTFIAIGLLHLYGKCGLIEMLRDKGYIVEPISIKSKN